MSSLARTMALVALPAAAIGAMVGLVLETREEPLPAPVGEDAVAPGAADAPASGRPRRPPRKPSPPRAGRANRVVGNDASPFIPLDPGFAGRLDSTDARTRLECALELLRMGTPNLRAVETLAVSTEAGRNLREAVAIALSGLAQIEKGEDYSRLPAESRLELRIRYFGKVVPPEMLSSERRRYWQARVDADPGRVATGAVKEGEAAWHELELARARLETGEMSARDYATLRALRMPAARRWFAELVARTDVGRDVVRDVSDALERLDRE